MGRAVLVGLNFSSVPGLVWVRIRDFFIFQWHRILLCEASPPQCLRQLRDGGGVVFLFTELPSPCRTALSLSPPTLFFSSRRPRLACGSSCPANETRPPSQWLQVSDRCPLCKTIVSRVLYDIKSPRDYKTHSHVRGGGGNPEGSAAAPSVAARTSLPGEQGEAAGGSRSGVARRAEFRSLVYRRGLVVEPPEDKARSVLIATTVDSHGCTHCVDRVGFDCSFCINQEETRNQPRRKEAPGVPGGVTRQSVEQWEQVIMVGVPNFPFSQQGLQLGDALQPTAMTVDVHCM